MGLIYDIFDRYSIISILIGFLLGFYLTINNNDSNVWIRAVPFIIVFSLVMTFLPTFAALLAKIQDDLDFSIGAILEAFFLNIAMITVCTAFGLFIASFFVGSLIPSNGVIFR